MAKKPTPKYRAEMTACISGIVNRNARETTMAPSGNIITLEARTVFSLRKLTRWNIRPKLTDPRMPPRKTRLALAPLNELEYPREHRMGSLLIC